MTVYCRSCGTQVDESASFCRECGSAIEDPVEADSSTHRDDEVAEWDDPAGVGRGGSGLSGRETAFYIGLVTGIAGVVFFGWVFFLIALPEAIAAVRGSTLQNHFPRDARTNPFIEGSMLAMRWYGNFLLLAIVLGVIVGILLVVT